MSVTGWMVSLTQRLTRIRSFQTVDVSTTSRASVVAVAHSLGFSLQNSTQPIGGRAWAPIATYVTRSAPAADDAPNMATMAAVSAAPSKALDLGDIFVDPSPVFLGP